MNDILFKTRMAIILNQPETRSYLLGKDGLGEPLYHEETVYPVILAKEGVSIELSDFYIPLTQAFLDSKNKEYRREFSINLDTLLFAIYLEISKHNKDSAKKLQTTVLTEVRTARLSDENSANMLYVANRCDGLLMSPEVEGMYPLFAAFRTLSIKTSVKSWQESPVFAMSVPNFEYALSRWTKEQVRDFDRAALRKKVIKELYS